MIMILSVCVMFTVMIAPTMHIAQMSQHYHDRANCGQENLQLMAEKMGHAKQHLQQPHTTQRNGQKVWLSSITPAERYGAIGQGEAK